MDPVELLEKDLPFVSFGELLGIGDVGDLDGMLCEKKVCGNKVMCFVNREKGVVVKEMRKNFNHGRDCCVVDECKYMFGLRKIGIGRVRSNKSVVRIDNKKSEWEGNMKFIDGNDVIYLVMDWFENEGSLVGKKDREENKDIMVEFLKIMLYRGIFRVSDGNYRNVLINKNKQLLSIDENNIGKRERILDPKFRIRDYSMEEIDSIVGEIMSNKEEKKIKIKEIMGKYQFSDDMCEMVCNNLDRLKEDVYNDINHFWIQVLNKEVKDNRSIRVFGSISYNGFKSDLLKSCIQKYVRRSEFDRGIYFLVELDLFKGFEELKNNKIIGGENIRSNMRNRLLIILGEDICYNDWRLWIKCGELIKKWDQCRLDEDNMDRVYLVNMFKILCDSDGYRSCSFLKSFYNDKSKKIKEKYKKEAHGLNIVKYKYAKQFYRDKDDVKFKRYLDGFVWRLDSGDNRVFNWFFKIFNFKGIVGKRNRRSRVIFVIMDILENRIRNIANVNMIKLMDMVFTWVINNNNSRNENWLWLVCLIKFYMNRDMYDWDAEVNMDLELSKEDVDKLYERNKSGYKMQVDDYCIDQHCYLGKKMGKNAMDFVNEGMLIVNENEMMKKECEFYKEVYIYRKKLELSNS